MTDNVENIVLEHLRHIRSRVDQIADDMSDLKARMSNLESAIVSVNDELDHADETNEPQQVT
jgi:outer membrane murein-binding lipoprotein Lpp